MTRVTPVMPDPDDRCCVLCGSKLSDLQFENMCVRLIHDEGDHRIAARNAEAHSAGFIGGIALGGAYVVSRLIIRPPHHWVDWGVALIAAALFCAFFGFLGRHAAGAVTERVVPDKIRREYDDRAKAVREQMKVKAREV